MELQSVGHDGQETATGSRASALNLERRLDHEGHSLALPSNDTVVENGMHSWGWRDPMTNSGDRTYGGKVIIVKLADAIKKIGVDGTTEAIKEAITSSFGLRSKRAFWLEDGDGVIRSLDREMPVGTYTLRLDEGVTVKICLQEDDNDQLLEPTIEKTFYTEEGFHEFLIRRQWLGLREAGSFRVIDTFDELRPMCIYQRA